MNNAKLYIKYSIVTKKEYYSRFLPIGDENNEPIKCKEIDLIYLETEDEKFFKKYLNGLLKEKNIYKLPKFKIVETNITDDLILEVEIKEIDYKVEERDYE